MQSDRPIAFLAFADARSDLSSLKVEGWALKDQFDELKQRGVVADVVVEEKATLERIYSVFLKHHDRIALFHFGGHADGDRLLLESAFERRPAYAEGLATLLGQQRGLKLIFLNGCSTRPQVKRLLDAGVPAVIATARPIDDRAATEFAVAFYQALTTGYSGENRKITGGCSLAMAFAQAEGLSKARRGANQRDFVAATPSHEDVIDDAGFPWKVHYRPGSEHVERWSLFEDDPLFGLPDLPTDIGWPTEPYRSLEYFRRDDARIFFGRGREIRELYNLLTLPSESAESRLIFYYGQTGVGKTSVLAAGLLPRMESLLATRYCRRSARDGLLNTLRDELAPRANPFDLGSAWLGIERISQRPLLIVLDQAEDAFTKPLAGLKPKDEIRALFEAVREAFAPTHAQRPRGRLILSFRKEWLAEFNEIRKALNLDIKPKMLDPLDRPGVIEAIGGPADHYGLVIDPNQDSVQPGETTLAEFMSHDLFDTLANPQTEQESPIAPTLQILLSRMWKEANDPKRIRGQPTFNRALYQDLKGKGFRLDEVIQEQLGNIAEVETLREVVEKGLLLDLLEFFTTREGTANAHTRQQVRARYPHQPAERLDLLLEACQNCYLLAHVGLGTDGTMAYRLTHDTLAPLLRERFRVSPDLAQRARHALEGRAATWKGQPTDPVLDQTDLASVEEGLHWMRVLDKDETALLEASRKARRRREQRELDEERRKKRLWRGLAVSVTTVMALGSGFFIWAVREWYHVHQITGWLAVAKRQGFDTGYFKMENGKYSVTFEVPEHDEPRGAAASGDTKDHSAHGGGRNGGDGLGRGEGAGPKLVTQAKDSHIQHVINEAPKYGIADLIGGLDLSDCGLSKVPEGISHFRVLESLNLSDNGIDNLSDEICQLATLTDLDIGRTGVSRLPKDIVKLTGLTRLHSPRSEFTTLPEDIDKLENLKFLHLARNHIKVIPNNIGKLTKLEKLILANNELSAIPDAIDGLHNLKILRLDGNEELKRLPETILKLPKLGDLDLPEGFSNSRDEIVEKLRKAGVNVTVAKGDGSGGGHRSGRGDGSGGGHRSGRGDGSGGGHRSGRGDGSGAGYGDAEAPQKGAESQRGANDSSPST
jgi:hypothetical protein